MTVGKKIKYYRTRLKMTQDRLAKLFDIHPVSIRKYKNDTSEAIQIVLNEILENKKKLSLNFNTQICHYRH